MNPKKLIESKDGTIRTSDNKNWEVRKKWEAEYRSKKREKIRKYQNERYKRIGPGRVDKVKKAAYMKKWRSANRVLKNNSDRKRRALKLSTEIGNLPIIIAWEARWKSQILVRCYWCLGDFDPSTCHADHVIPLQRNGPHSIENLCIACADCNLSKNRKSLEAWNLKIEQPVLF